MVRIGVDKRNENQLLFRRKLIKRIFQIVLTGNGYKLIGTTRIFALNGTFIFFRNLFIHTAIIGMVKKRDIDQMPHTVVLTNGP